MRIICKWCKTGFAENMKSVTDRDVETDGAKVEVERLMQSSFKVLRWILAVENKNDGFKAILILSKSSFHYILLCPCEKESEKTKILSYKNRHLIILL